MCERARLYIRANNGPEKVTGETEMLKIGSVIPDYKNTAFVVSRDPLGKDVLLEWELYMFPLGPSALNTIFRGILDDLELRRIIGPDEKVWCSHFWSEPKGPDFAVARLLSNRELWAEDLGFGGNPEFSGEDGNPDMSTWDPTPSGWSVDPARNGE
jgi:hypothetical protein